jgi:predicted RNase H-like HicB family nuclease
MRLNIHVRSQFGTVQAFCPDLPGCSATGQDQKVAIERLRARIDEYFAVRVRPLPPGTRVFQIEV